MGSDFDEHTRDESRLNERRLQAFAALTLGCIMAGHVLLETAGDALFLANVAVERLPLVTIGVALLALGVASNPVRHSHRRILFVTQIVAVVGTLALWSLVIASFEWSYYALVLWSGIITSVIVVRFWLVLGEMVTIGQGKRLFAAIAMGGSIGALLGSGLAALIAPTVGGQGLLVASAAAYATSLFGPSGFGKRAETPGLQPVAESPPATRLRTSVRDLLDSPYARRVALLVVLGGMTLTLGDYLFKSVLTEKVPADQLATWLSRIYFGLNVSSIAMLAFGVTPMVRRLGVDRGIVVLPILIALAGFGVLAGAALVSIVFLKLSDGTLRYSLHRTSLELLYLPMSPALRASVKGAIDIVGQSGAKALASVLILGLVLAPHARPVIAAAVVLSATVWIVIALRLRQTYLDVFRQTLSDGAIETMIDHPELDLESAGSLVRALSDPDERRALAAMQLLVERGQSDLISSLIVYHPSPKVVVRAIDVFSSASRDDLPALLGHLIEHEEANVRAAAVRAAWALDSEAVSLLELADSECLSIQASAMAGLLDRDQIKPERYSALFDDVLAYENSDPKLAVATAARLSYHPVYHEILIQLAMDQDPDVADEAIRAVRASHDAWFTSPLVDLLGDRKNRENVRLALIERGVSALTILEHRLTADRTPISILRHIPRTIARFETPEAAGVLINGAMHIENGMVRFKLLRGLETLMLDRGPGRGLAPRLAKDVDLSGIKTLFEQTLERALDLLRLESTLSATQKKDARLHTTGGELLVDLLRDKRALARGRLFMMLGLMYPREDFRAIETGLSSRIATDHASAEELIETLLTGSVARGMLGLSIDDSVSAQKIAANSSTLPETADYAALLRLAVRDGSQSVRAVAIYHAGEIGISLGPESPAAQDDDPATSIPMSLKDRGLAAVGDLFDFAPLVAARSTNAK